MSAPTARPVPLFYRKPQPLIPVIHDDVRLTDGNYAFAAETNAVSLAVIEFASAMRHYPPGWLARAFKSAMERGNLLPASSSRRTATRSSLKSRKQ